MEKYFQISESGVNVRCKLYYKDRPAAGRVVVFAHGFGGHKDNRAAARFADRLLSKYKDTALCAFDWPCHGDDVKKKLRLKDCDLYLKLVTDWARQKLGAAELYAYGTSFGGYLLLRYIHENGNPFVRLALRCPAVPMYDSLTTAVMTEDNLKKLAKKKEQLVGFDRKVRIDAAFLQELKEADIAALDYSGFAPAICILHGTCDEIVPMEAVRAFAARNGIQFIPVEGADHRFRDSGKMDIAIREILTFFSL